MHQLALAPSVQRIQDTPVKLYLEKRSAAFGFALHCIRHRRIASSTKGAVCSARSKMSRAWVSVPWLSMRSFPIR